MEKIFIIDVKLGDDELAAIASCVTNIEQLRIKNKDDTKLTIKGICELAQGISNRNKPVSCQQQVHFSYNEQFSIVS